MIHVLYLDDESHNLTAFRAAFRRVFKVHVTTEPTEAVQLLREHPIEVVISDQKMPSLSGVEFFELIMSDFPDPIRMLLTGHADIDAVIDAINKGQIYKYISKPWNEAELQALVEEAANQFRRKRSVQQEGDRMIEQMRQAKELAAWIVEVTASGGADVPEIHEKAKKIDELLS
jgi:response regulator RpfG family c-di-GMP phosphodiesterase